MDRVDEWKAAPGHIGNFLRGLKSVHLNELSVPGRNQC